MRGVARLLVFVLVFATSAIGVSLRAQTEAPAAKEMGTVGTLKVRFVGTANVNEEIVRANMSLREGATFEESMIDHDIRSLYRTGLFEFIEVKREALPGSVVNLVVEVTPKFRVLNVVFDGNKHVKKKRLEKETKTKPNLALDERQVKEDAEKIRTYYQKSGYSQVAVDYTLDRNRETGFGTVTFRIREGAKVKLDDIRFQGNEHVKSRRLRKEMETKRWWMFSWLTGSGRFKDEPFDDDLEKLRDYYREQGYLDVDISPGRIVYDYPKSSKLVVTIPIVEGRQYRIGEITISGNVLYPEKILRLVLRQKTGKVFAPSLLDKDVEALEDFYGKSGYLETKIRPVRKPNLTTGAIDIAYEIEESEKYYVESIAIEGNTKTKSIVILRELVLGPGEVFDTVRMKISKLRLENTRFFEDVNLTPETTSIPGRRNLKVVVEEGRTGNLTFGAGFSSLEKAVIFAELSQSNFDLFNRRSVFQGDGQKFRLRLSLGSQSSEAVLSFEEPWLFERELALGFSLYRTSSDYDSSFYQEVRTGGEVYLRKRLFELVEARLSYTYEIVEISDLNSGYEVIYAPGRSVISKVGLQLLRDTRDKIVNTTAGNRVELLTEITGGPLGGDYEYYKLEARGSQFFPLFEAQQQVLALIGRLGVADSYGDGAEVPAFDSFFLGGPYTLRGFEYRDVGPKNAAGQILGGDSYGFFSAEYSLDIVSPVRFALFYDAGFVNVSAYDFHPGSYNDNFGFGLRLFVAGAPLSLDFGIPLTTDKFNDGGNQFNFSFGTRF